MTAAALKSPRRYGAIAQLVEHLHGMQGVRSSSLLGSILRNSVPDWVFLYLGFVTPTSLKAAGHVVPCTLGLHAVVSFRPRG